MRLALISSLVPPETLGGAEAYVRDSARSLAERHDVVVLTGSRTHDLDGTPVVNLPRLPRLAPTAPIGGRVLWHALDQWLPHVHVAVSRTLRRLNPDVVVTHQLQGLSAAVFTGIAARQLRHVHTAHDLNLLCARMTMTRDGKFCGGHCAACRVQKAVRGTAAGLNLSRLVAMSRYIRDRHVGGGIVPRERAEAIRLGAEPGTARLRRCGEAPLTLGFIGSVARHKGIRTLLEAFSRAEEPWRLLVAGSGSLESEVHNAASRDPRITYLGQVQEGRKDAFFDELDLVVIPSEWEEPATFVAVEAAVRGLPAVVSDRGGLTETPEARTFRAGDPQELLRAVQWFAEEPVRIEDASRRLLARQNEFEWSTHMSRIEALLEEVRSDSR